jgi:Tol biopolymer transport system component
VAVPRHTVPVPIDHQQPVESSGWDISDTDEPSFDVEFSTTEGTWMSVDVSPDGQVIVFDLLGHLYSIPAAGGDATLLVGGAAMNRLPTFSPDGDRILYLSDGDGYENVWICGRDGSRPQQVTSERIDLLTGPAWFPDGASFVAAKIYSAYTRYRSSEIRLFGLAEGAPHRQGRLLVESPATRRSVLEPEFSPDGRYLYYTELLTAPNIYLDANHINHAIMRHDMHSGVVEQLVTGFGGAFAPRVSADGSRLAFVRRVMARTVLFVLDLRTGEQIPLWDQLDRDNSANWELQGNYYPRFSWFPNHEHICIWAHGKLFKVSVQDGGGSEIPFNVTVRHRVTARLSFPIDLAPTEVGVRAVRNVAPSTDEHSIVVTALAQLWRKELPTGKPELLTHEGRFAFDPAFSPIGDEIAYVEWDDEQGSALKVGPPDGQQATVLATSTGVIRQPRFSPDGQQLVYRIQSPDVSMGGARAKPGIYLVDRRTRTVRFVVAGDAAPQFSPDGNRIFYVEIDRAGASACELLRSVTLDGLGVREHARTPDVDTSELRVSPDLRWIAFKDRQQYYVLSYIETGRVLLVHAATDEVPVRKLTRYGGDALAWSVDGASIHWVLGPHLYRAEVERLFAAEAATSRDEWRRIESHASLDLTVPADIPAGTIAFTNGRIITMRADEVIEPGTLIVSANRIIAVGPSADTPVPVDAKVVDVGGKTLMPGLIDAHGHIDACWATGTAPQKQPGRYAALAFGVTTNFDPYPNELTSYESTETTLAGITIGPRWIGTGRAIWGRAQHLSGLYWPIETYSDAQDLVTRKKALGGPGTVIKSYKQPARRQRQMIVKAGREAGLNVVVEGENHFYNQVTMILDGHTNLEHNLPLANYYDDLVQLMALAKAHNTPTLVVCFGELFGENYLYQTTEAWRDPKVSTYVQETLSGYSPLGTPYGAPPYVRGMTTIHVADEIYDIGFRAVARSTKKLNDAGVVINAGSHGQIPGLAMHWEMALLAEGGMANIHILRAATLSVAKTLGVDAQIGSLEEGKLADLIVLDENPLENIRHSETVRYTMINGRMYDSTTMDEVGNYSRPRTKFYWELQERHGVDWNEAWAGNR